MQLKDGSLSLLAGSGSERHSLRALGGTHAHDSLQPQLRHEEGDVLAFSSLASSQEGLAGPDWEYE